jgi:predicted RNA binding protein YcfA (HicA-like mRNA interferase family)
MGERIPKITAAQLVRVVKKLGYQLDRQSGSHAVYYHAVGHQRVVIPIHARVILKPKTLASILEDLGLSIPEFRRLL